MSETWAQRAPWTGIAAVVLVIISALVGGETPAYDASNQEILDFYEDDKQALVAFIAVLGMIFFVFFAATLRSRMRAAETFSTLTLVGGTVFAIGLAIFAGIQFTLADLVNSDSVDRIDPGALQALNALNSDLFFPAVLGLSVFYFGTSLAILSTGEMPRWWGWVTLALAIISLLGPGGFVAFLALAPWTVVAAILLLTSGGGAGTTAGAGGPRTEYRENPVGQ